MILVLLLEPNRGTVDSYLQTWGRSFQEQLRSVTYESLTTDSTLKGGTFIFTDLERLTESQCRRADTLAAAVESAGGRVLNHPSRVLRRHDLLRTLHDSGSNPFNVYRESELNGSVRFPVFVRHELEHDGALTPLLRNADELTQALAQVKQSPKYRGKLLIVEFADTTDKTDGLFRKYSVMRFGHVFVPRHLFFSNTWLSKKPSIVTAQTVAQENAFLRDFSLPEQIRRIFDTACIDYGRIDYTLLNGNVVTWEINTNPEILAFPEMLDLRRLMGQGYSARLIRVAWLELAKAKDLTVSLSGCPRIVEDSLSAPAQSE